VASGYGVEAVFRGIEVFPGKILFGPSLQDKEEKQYEEWAQIDEQIFVPVRFEDDEVLNGHRATFQSSALRISVVAIAIKSIILSVIVI
jgi:hypothetical protein